MDSFLIELEFNSKQMLDVTCVCVCEYRTTSRGCSVMRSRKNFFAKWNRWMLAVSLFSLHEVVVNKLIRLIRSGICTEYHFQFAISWSIQRRNQIKFESNWNEIVLSLSRFVQLKWKSFFWTTSIHKNWISRSDYSTSGSGCTFVNWPQWHKQMKTWK